MTGCPYPRCAELGRDTTVRRDGDRWELSCPCGWFNLIKET